MEKKIYMSPMTSVLAVEYASALAVASGVNGDKDGDAPGSDIGYGGVDEEGNMNPSSRRKDVWDDEEAEEDS